MNSDRILALGSHPDDIEFGCGGTLLSHARRGSSVYLFVATNGAAGGDGATRRREQADSAVVMRARQVIWGRYEDTELPLDRELIVTLEAVIRELQPATIFVHHPGDTHQDHRSLARAAMSAARAVPNLLYYEGPSTQQFVPNCYVDIADILDAKTACLEAHRSQVEKTNIEGLTICELALSTANFRGTQARVKYAEAFHAVRLLLEPS